MTWMIGADTDVPALHGLLGGNSVAAVTVGQALHWMSQPALFRAGTLRTRMTSHFLAIRVRPANRDIPRAAAVHGR